MLPDGTSYSDEKALAEAEAARAPAYHRGGQTGSQILNDMTVCVIRVLESADGVWSISFPPEIPAERVPALATAIWAAIGDVEWDASPVRRRGDLIARIAPIIEAMEGRHSEERIAAAVLDELERALLERAPLRRFAPISEVRRDGRITG